MSCHVGVGRGVRVRPDLQLLCLLLPPAPTVQHLAFHLKQCARVRCAFNPAHPFPTLALCPPMPSLSRSFHNMQGLFAAMGNGGPISPVGRQAQEKSRRFDEWLQYVTTDPSLSYEQRTAKLAAWRQAPEGTYAHPREEHLIPVRGGGWVGEWVVGGWVQRGRVEQHWDLGGWRSIVGASLDGSWQHAAALVRILNPEGRNNSLACPCPLLRPPCSCMWCLARARATPARLCLTTSPWASSAPACSGDCHPLPSENVQCCPHIPMRLPAR